MLVTVKDSKDVGCTTEVVATMMPHALLQSTHTGESRHVALGRCDARSSADRGLEFHRLGRLGVNSAGFRGACGIEACGWARESRNSAKSVRAAASKQKESDIDSHRRVIEKSSRNPNKSLLCRAQHRIPVANWLTRIAWKHSAYQPPPRSNTVASPMIIVSFSQLNLVTHFVL